MRTTTTTATAFALAVAATALALASVPERASAAPTREVAHSAKKPKKKRPRIATNRVKVVKIRYLAHNRSWRNAYVVLPKWYSRKRQPRIPLIISPHGRGLDGRANARLWGNLPADGPFAVVNPDGQGRRLPKHSWGYAGQIEDLARMPKILKHRLPWLRFDHRRVYAFGGSMGGQESLLLLARKPRLLAGVAVFDSVTDFGAQYKRFPEIRCNARCRRNLGEPLGRVLIRQARREVGGAPWKRPNAYRQRSPLAYVEEIARSCVPLQLWWSVADQIVRDASSQSGALFWRLRQLNRTMPVHAFVGNWIHTAVMRASTRLPLALSHFHLLRKGSVGHGPALRELVPNAPWRCGWGGGEAAPPIGDPDLPVAEVPLEP